MDADYAVMMPAVASSMQRVPTSVRLAVEIPKPKDWQAFQRNCVILFREELGDPHAMEYGRNGQKQYGIDILAQRSGDPAHTVGIQCRRYQTALKYSAMLKDCRDAAKHFPNLREFIFATTSPDSTLSTDEVARVQAQLAAEGYSIRVVIYGWDQLQQVIARHPPAYEVFSASYQDRRTPEPNVDLEGHLKDSGVNALAERLAELLAPRLGTATSPTLPANEPEILPGGAASEDPALHGRIDVFRDIFVKDGQPELARKGLLALKAELDLVGKPWARYRIESNLAAVEFHLGNEDQAVALFEAAYELRPHDTKAKAHLAIARLAKGRYPEALDLAREALAGTPKPEAALTCLIQAAAMSGSTDDPRALIPEELEGTVGADLGLAEAYRHQRVANWQSLCIELAQRHPGVREFVPINALAVLSLAIESEMMIPGGVGPVTAADLTNAANGMRKFVSHLLDIGYSDQANLRAHLNNTCVLLRLCGRSEEIETLLTRAPDASRNDPVLRLQMAVALWAMERPAEAAKLLEGDDNAENKILRIHLLADSNPAAALQDALALAPEGLCPKLAWLRWSLIAELGLKLERLSVLPEAIAAIRQADPTDPAGAVYELRARRLEGLGDTEFEEELTRLARAFSKEAPMEQRCFLASELRDARLLEDASLLLDNYVDLSRASPTAILYLKVLAGARRDEAFKKALERSALTLRELPEVLWLTAAHAWNIGDLTGSYDAISRLVELNTNNLSARLFKIQVLVRQNKLELVRSELERPLENASSPSIKDRLQVLSLLSHFNFLERAACYAYRLLLENRDNPRIWMALAGVVLGEGRSGPRERDIWLCDTIRPDVAVDVEYEDGSKAFFVVEADPSLCRLDDEAREPTHPFVKPLLGLKSGARFNDASGRSGIITQLRHKVVARFHKVLAEYEERFPEQEGFRSMKFSPGEVGGLDEMTERLKDRSEFVDQEQKKYLEGDWPLALLAARLGADVIDVAEGLAIQGLKLKTALGNPEDRRAASVGILENNRQGLVLDLHSFWTAWRLKVLEVLVSVGGPIHVGQNTVDRLRSRRDALIPSQHAGTMHAVYQSGRVAIQEVGPDVIRENMMDLSGAIEWIEAHAKICPIIAGDDLPPTVREHLGLDRSEIYHALIIARNLNILLVTDDLFIRKLGYVIGFSDSCWTQAILDHAQSFGHIARERYVRALAALIGAGHDYLSVTADDFLEALRLDAAAGKAPGPIFKQLSENIGGRAAEPLSHVSVVIRFLHLAWRDQDVKVHRKAATSFLLRQLIRFRHGDYGQMLRIIFEQFPATSELGEFLRYWQTGHFIANNEVFGQSRRTSML